MSSGGWLGLAAASPFPRLPVSPSLPQTDAHSCHARATMQSVSTVLAPRGTIRYTAMRWLSWDMSPISSATDSLPPIATGEAPMVHQDLHPAVNLLQQCFFLPFCLLVSKCALLRRPRPSRLGCMGQHTRSSTHKGKPQPHMAQFATLGLQPVRTVYKRQINLCKTNLTHAYERSFSSGGSQRS